MALDALCSNKRERGKVMFNSFYTSIFSKSIDNEIIPTSTYQGCECPTCKELNVDCADCPECANPVSETDSEVAMAMYDSSIGKADPCWEGYVQRGMKEQGGKMVPNCIPVTKSDEVVEDLASFAGIGKDYTKSTKEIHRVEE
jgi:hypothetical protein